jgi:FkbM family methyltransferase
MSIKNPFTQTWDLFFQSADALKVIVRSNRAAHAFLKKGASISATRILENLSTLVPDLRTIYDAGAHKGQFALACAHYYPQANIYSFEPVPQTFEALRANTRKARRIVPIAGALGSTEGVLDFYHNQYSHASSALKVNDLQKQLLPKTSVYQCIQVPVHPLDHWTAKWPQDKPILLKMDVQGYEREVLKGASMSLPGVEYILLESSFQPLYEGEPVFEEMHDLMKTLGYALVAPLGFLESNRLQVLQMDLLYKKKA